MLYAKLKLTKNIFSHFIIVIACFQTNGAMLNAITVQINFTHYSSAQKCTIFPFVKWFISSRLNQDHSDQKMTGTYFIIEEEVNFGRSKEETNFS